MLSLPTGFRALINILYTPINNNICEKKTTLRAQMALPLF
jgi:hypothetical protein